jgi:hypothetical protein
MNAVTYAKKTLEQTFALFNVIADGLTDAQYNWKPEGTANNIAKSHVHAMSSIDFFINATLAGGQMIWPEVAARNGLPENPTEIWAHASPIPFPPMKEYAARVQKAALDYVSTLSDADLDREVETPFFGKKNVAFLVALSGVHAMGHGGDIAAIKGLQGLKGLPF